MLKAPISLNVELFYEDLLECIEYGNLERATKLLSIPEVVARALIPNSVGELEVLNSAAKGGSLPIFEALIQNPNILARVTHYSSSFDTGLLGIAVENNNLILVQKLLSIPNLIEKAKNLPWVLGSAAHLGRIAIVKEFLSTPKVASHAYSALHYALDEGTEPDQIVAIKLLLSAPKVIEQIIAERCTQVVHGFFSPEIAQLLLGIPAISEAIHREPSVALRHACTREMAAVLSIPSLQNRLAQLQAHNGFDLAFYNRMISEFETDLDVGNLELIKKLLNIKPIGDYFSIALKSENQKIPAFAGRLDLLEYFIEDQQGDPEVDEELFSWACEGGNIDVVLYLLRFGSIREIVLSDTRGQCNLLNDAAVSGNVKILNLLLSLISYDTTIMLREALVSASELGHIDIVKRLLELPNVHNDTSIMKLEAIVQAAKQGHVGVLTLLLQTPHDISKIQERDIREILNSHLSTLAIIESLLAYPFIAEHPCLAIGTLSAAERSDLWLMKCLLTSPGAIAGLRSQPDLSIKVLKATLKTIKKMEDELPTFKSDFGNAQIDIIAALDKVANFDRILVKQHLTKMQRTAFDTYYAIKPSLLDSPVRQFDQEAEECQSCSSTTVIFSSRKREQREDDLPAAAVAQSVKADNLVKRLRPD